MANGSDTHDARDARLTEALTTVYDGFGGLRWRWVAIGTVVGVALITVFGGVVLTAIPRAEVAGLVVLTSLLATGMLVGYESPGETLAEPAVAGILIAALSSGTLTLVTSVDLTVPFTVAWLVSAPVVTLAGGWVGEIMQGTMHAQAKPITLRWPWVLAGVILGFVLTTYAVFVGRALFDLTAVQLLVALAAALFLNGFLGALLSPGVTLIEPVLAAIGVVVLDIIVVVAGLGTVFPPAALAIALASGIVLAFFGGVVGEAVQAYFRRATW